MSGKIISTCWRFPDTRVCSDWTGTGCLYIGDRVKLDSFREGGTGSYSEREEQPETLPDKYESGTLKQRGYLQSGSGH